MHVTKGTKADFQKLFDEAINRNNSKVGTIDPSRTRQNYELTPTLVTDIDEHIKNNLGVKRKIQSNAVRCVSVIVDYPPDEQMEEKEFFKQAMNGILEFFGVEKECVLYSVVHKDEGHPHLHLSFAPVQESEKKYKDGHVEKIKSLSAKKMVTKEKLQLLHPYVQGYMQGVGAVGTLYYNDGQKRNLSFVEHKKEMIMAEIGQAQQDIDLEYQLLEHEKNEFQNDLQEALDKQTLFLEQIEQKIEEAPKADKETLKELDNLIQKVEYTTNKPLTEKGNQVLALKPETWKTVLKTLKTIKNIINPLIQIKEKIRAQFEAENGNNTVTFGKRKSLLNELTEAEEQVKERDMEDYIKSIRVPVKEKEKGRER